MFSWHPGAKHLRAGRGITWFLRQVCLRAAPRSEAVLWLRGERSGAPALQRPAACVLRQGGWLGRSPVAFAGEQTFLILRFAIITSQGELPTSTKEVSSPGLRKVVFEQNYFPPTLPLYLTHYPFERPMQQNRLAYDFFWSRSVPP